MKYKKIFLLTIILIGLSVFVITRTASLGFTKCYIVKLYSSGQVVRTWKARDFGRLDGETLIFTIGGDLDPVVRSVRINGSYSVEEIEE